MEKEFFFFFFSSRRRHTRLQGDWSSDVCSSDLHTHGWEPRGPQASGGQELLEIAQPSLAPWWSCNCETPHQGVLCRLLPEFTLMRFEREQIRIQHNISFQRGTRLTTSTV